MDTDDAPTTLIVAALHYARAAERVRNMLIHLKPLIEEVGALADLDPDLTPELQAITVGLDGAGEAIARMHTFLEARYDTVLAEARAKTKGDTDA